MRRSALLAGVLAAAFAGCSLIQRSSGMSAADRMRAGLAALATNDRVTADEHLRWVYEHHWQEPIGRQALLAMAAAELDPRNPTRRLWASAEMSAQFLGYTDTQPWLQPVAETLYLLSLELGANEERIARIEAELDSARALPKLPGPSFLAKMNEVTSERDALKERVTTLEQTLAAREQALQASQQELERVLRTLRVGGRGGTDTTTAGRRGRGRSSG